MDGPRRYRGGFYGQEVQGRRSHNRKPPLATCQPSVPSWEKQFCSLVGSVPWKKLLETKRFMYLYEDVVNWNDSACEEAFHNAKNRYWSEINGLPCDIALPDPDIYIDQIDWNSEIDPELLLDLERDLDTPEEDDKTPEEDDKDEKGVILNNTLLLNQSFSCTGWGDEEDFQKDIGMGFASGYGDCTQNGSNRNSWEEKCYPCNGTRKDDVWGGNFNESWGRNQGSNYDQSYNTWDNNYNNQDAGYNEVRNVDDQRGDGDWRTWKWDSQKREGAGWNMSRYKTSRFSGGDEYQMDRGWKNRRGWKKSNIACG